MDDKTMALLGDKSAQERLTDRGVILPFQSCRSEVIKVKRVLGAFWCKCEKCGATSGYGNSAKAAVEIWNSRAPILTPELLKRLEETE